MKARVFKAPSNSKLNCKMNQTKMNHNEHDSIYQRRLGGSHRH